MNTIFKGLACFSLGLASFTQASESRSLLQNSFEAKFGFDHQRLHTDHFLNPEATKSEDDLVSAFNLTTRYTSSFTIDNEIELVTKTKDALKDGSFKDADTQTEFESHVLSLAKDWGDYQITLGKQRFGTSVSYFFKPFKLEFKNRRSSEVEAEKGLLAAKLQGFTEAGASFQFTIFRPDQDDATRQTFTKQDYAADFLYSYFGNDFDAHLRFQEGEDSSEAALALSYIANDYLEIHSSHRFFEGGWDYDIVVPTTTNRPLRANQGILISENDKIAQQHVLGINLARSSSGESASRWGLISEYIYDGNAPDEDFWADLNSLIDSHGKFGPPAGIADVLGRDNTYRQALNSRLAYTHSFPTSEWEAALVWLRGKTKTAYDDFYQLEIERTQENVGLFDSSAFPDSLKFSAGYFANKADDGRDAIIANRIGYSLEFAWKR